MASWDVRDVLPSSIIPTLASYPDLSTLYSYINGSTKLFNLLNTAENFTFLAPTNDAIAQWIVSNGNNTPAADVIEAQLSYHLLNGSWPTVDFTAAPQFAATDLTNSTYNNVTIFPGGQRVELVAGPGGDPEIISSNKTATTISTKDVVCLNGLIQFVNSILSIPTSLVLLTAQANMSFFIAILNRANFLSINDQGLIEFVNYASFTPNMTFFVPNSAAALATFTDSVSTNISAADLTALFDYHIVPDQVLYSPDFVNGTILRTAQGDNLTITTVGNDTYVNMAKILESDYLIVNGVIHTIDNLLDRSNETIPQQAIANTTSPSSRSSGSSSGLSTGAKAAIGVVIPVVVLAVLAALFFWFWRRRKAKRIQAELDSSAVVGEMGTTPAAASELYSPGPKKALPSQDAPGELPSDTRPQELAGGANSLRPVELE
ncbi:Fasciclin arabinogalactan [Hyphodiscus hymeniophilus]|uniref:Fasciclin arabinogalactan n=1 Tax=Hyphodiscus hymeniophilus TaxID=353542 RepID=A0A9P6VQJ4_9HELO|nr:Fasciclin arabinogalactan [Hyphodiscus hymeniophilus]